ncbi:hypothetical protein [Nostoc sp.]|uniref:hypothetical protein n=1 Tax=Nostoc sp. TaxID=1180 RepID=UPI002FFA7C8F
MAVLNNSSFHSFYAWERVQLWQQTINPTDEQAQACLKEKRSLSPKKININLRSVNF